MAVAFVAGDGNKGVMKIGLLYEDGAQGTAQEELETRLSTYESVRSGQAFCDSASTETHTLGGSTLVVGTCSGGLSESWASLIQTNDTLFLAENVP